MPGTLPEALVLAEKYAEGGREIEIIDLLGPYLTGGAEVDRSHRPKSDLLLAAAYAHAGRLAEAEEALRGGPNDSPAHYYILAQVKLSLREFEGVVAAGEDYFDLIEMGEGRGWLTRLYTSTAHQARVHDLMGVASAASKQPEAAETSWRLAINLNPTDQRSYLNLVNQLLRQENFEAAKKVIARGLERCVSVSELQMLADSTQAPLSISACLMVKNEEELLPECLASIRDWVTEIVVVDTGSTDRTVEIAGEYGARIFHQPWAGDFSKHRNYSIAQASGDWIFIIDADERFAAEDVPLIKEAMRLGRFEMLSICVYNVYQHDTDQLTFANSVRFFKRDLNMTYRGIVHNELRLAPGKQVLRTPAKLTHLGYGLSEEQMEQKFERTQELLLKQLDESPDNAFALFNYAQLLRGAPKAYNQENSAEIIRTAERVVKLTDSKDSGQQHLHLMCRNHLAAAFLATGEYEKARRQCQAALELRPNYLDALIHLGFAYYRLGQYDDAILQFEAYLSAQREFDGVKEITPIILTHPQARDLAYTHLGVLHELAGRPEKARKCYLQALEVTPGYQETAAWLGRSYLAAGDRVAAEKYFKHQLEHSQATAETLTGLARLEAERGQEVEAGTYFSQALADFGDNVEVRRWYGQFLVDQGNLEEALAAFEKAVELDEGAHQLEGSLAAHLFEGGYYAPAAKFYESAISNYEPTSEFLNDLGNCFFKLADFEQAEKQYARAVQTEPVLTLAYRNLGLARANLDRPEDALVALGQFGKRAGNDPELFPLVANLCMKTGDFEQAIGLWEEILAGDSDNTEALFGLSESYRLAGQADAALLGYRRLLEIDPDCQLARKRVQVLSRSESPA